MIAIVAGGLAAVTGAFTLAAVGDPASAGPHAGAPARLRDDLPCPWLDSRLPVAQRVDELLRAMSPLQEGELVHLYWGGSSANPFEGQSPAMPALCLPAITEQDGSAGVGSGWVTATGHFQGVTQLPAPIADAGAFDPGLARQYGTVIGGEDAAVGVDMALAPTINIERDPLWGRAYESLGEDPYLTASLGVGLVEGIQSRRVVAVVKHFAAYNQETNRGTLRDDALLSARALQEIYLPAWAATVQQAHPGGVMCAYNLINGVPSCQDSALLQAQLHGVWNYQGFVRSDCGSVFDQTAALAAGVAQVKCSRLYQPRGLAEAVSAGRLSRRQLDELLRPVLTVLFRYDLVAAPHRPRPDAQVSTAVDRAVALRTANEGSVLLHNDGILPLDLATVGSVALIGAHDGSPMTAGYGAMRVHTPGVVTAYAALRSELGSRLRYYAGTNPAVAARVARSATVAVVVVHDTESEGRDRTSLQLPGNQDRLIETVEAANPRTVVVLETGAPVLMPWLGRTAAVLETWYPGQEAGLSLEQLLSGQVDPSGKLPVSWPATAAARPDTAPSAFGGRGPTRYTDGIDVGYRWYDATGVRPAFPFGFGLSYTRFSFSDLSVTPGDGGGWIVTARVTNTGTRAGADVGQCYVGYPAATGEPPRQLRGFQRVQLRPGQAATVRCTITPGDLSAWDQTSGSWNVAAGRYTFWVGDSSQLTDLGLQASVPVAAASLGPDGGPAPLPH